MKPSIVLLPALLCNAGLFIHQIKSLEASYDFFVPETGLETNVGEAARRILRQAPDRFVLGGISMGGYIAFEILRQAPERVAGLILMDTNAHSDPPAAQEKREAMIEKAKTEGIESVIAHALLDIILPAHRDNEIIRHILTHMAQTIGVEKYVNQQTLIKTRPDSTDLLAQITCPAMIMGGAQDALSPTEALDKIAEQIPKSMHVIIENSGHLPPIENPAAVTAAWRIFFEHVGIS
ncbi:MAG: alpha/beta fold hydrolase [Alphaproteobacteria bacterium]|nr:alpha/beta fold hydrolase [Alphaproteobacteria bacterium]